MLDQSGRIAKVIFCAHRNPEVSVDEARFDSHIRKNGYMLLTAKLVSAVLNVPADKLWQIKILGCRYSWGNENEIAEAAISLIPARKSDGATARWFGNATKRQTAEDRPDQ